METTQHQINISRRIRTQEYAMKYNKDALQDDAFSYRSDIITTSLYCACKDCIKFCCYRKPIKCIDPYLMDMRQKLKCLLVIATPHLLSVRTSPPVLRSSLEWYSRAVYSVLLPTWPGRRWAARILDQLMEVSGEAGMKYTAHLLLGNGSTGNFITESLTKHLIFLRRGSGIKANLKVPGGSEAGNPDSDQEQDRLGYEYLSWR